MIYLKSEVLCYLHPIFMLTETFHVSVIAQNATMVIYRFLFGGMHPIARLPSKLEPFTMVFVQKGV